MAKSSKTKTLQVGPGKYETKVIEVNVRPKLRINVDAESGETSHEVKQSNTAKKALKILIDPQGQPVYPHNLYLNSILRRHRDNTNTAALALLSFTRHLSSIGKTYRDVTDDEEESPIWLYVDYLLDNLKEVDPNTGQFTSDVGYSLSTARTYTDVVISFYKWMHRYGILPIDEEHKSLEFEYVRVKPGENKHDKLLHTRSNRPFEVQTTTLKKRFPKIQSTPPELKLKPLKPSDLTILNEYLSGLTGEAKTKSLMLRLALATGLRLEEFVTFPEVNITYPMEDCEVIPYTISKLQNGCNTKFNKERTIEIPYELMLELDEYKHSEERSSNLKKARLTLDENGEQIPQKGVKSTPHGRLFVSRKGLPYSTNTLETFFSEVRRGIRESHPNWYYRVHDLRSTFATTWLGEEALERKVAYDYLLGELAVLMGHSSTKETQKYIDFMNSKKVKIEHSAKKNERIRRAMGRVTSK